MLCVLMSMSGCVCKLELYISCFSQPLSIFYFFLKRVSCWTWTSSSGLEQVTSKRHGSSQLCFSSAGIASAVQHLTWLLWLMLARQALYHLSHLPKSLFHIFVLRGKDLQGIESESAFLIEIELMIILYTVLC